MLPELPRLVHQALQRQGLTPDNAVLLALLAEQRATRRLLQGVLWAVAGFTLGMVVTWLLTHGWA